MRKWRIEDSEELYNITGWGTSYFGINDKGHVVVTPRKDGVSVDLKELVDELQLRDVASPMLVRFPDILDNRIEKMSSCFKQAAEEYGYKAQNFIRLRSTRCALWWKKLSATERSSISDWKPALNRNSMR
jgi:arginine decarboxylase